MAMLLLQSQMVEKIHLKELLNPKQGFQRPGMAPGYGTLEEGGRPWVQGGRGAPWGAEGRHKQAVVSVAITSTQHCTRATACFCALLLETHCVDITVAAAIPHHPPPLFLMIKRLQLVKAQ